MTSILKDNLYDENTNYIEDIVFLSQYLKNVKKVKILNSSFYCIRVNQNSITNKEDKTYSNIKSICYSIDKLKKNNIGKIAMIENKEMFLIYYELEKIKNEKSYNKAKENEGISNILVSTIENIDHKIEYKDYIYNYLKINNYKKWKNYAKRYNKMKQAKCKLNRMLRKVIEREKNEK